MEYLTFELEIDKKSSDNGQHEYEARVLHAPAGGEPHELMLPLLPKTELQESFHALQTKLRCSTDKSGCTTVGLSERSLRELGQALFEAAIAGNVHVCYERSLEKARKEGKGLRVQLRIVAAELATWPWEYMYDPDHGVYLGRSSETPIVRYLELPKDVEHVTVEGPLRILGMVANPQATDPLKLQDEQRKLEEAVDSLQQQGLLELTWVTGETWEDLQRTMRRGPWHIFHFIGHGGFDMTQVEGYIVLSDEQDREHHLAATGLADLLTVDHQQCPRLVVLNTCQGARSSEQDIFSSSASILIRRGIPAVVAMQYAISDKAAIEFSKSFYTALVHGRPIEAAIADARLAIYMNGRDAIEWGTPVLYSHARDGVLFTLELLPRRQLSLDLNPKKISGWRKGVFVVEVCNHGSVDETVSLEVSNLKDGCSYTFDSPKLTVPAGGVNSTQLTVSASTFLLWQPKVRSFTVSSRSDASPQIVQTVTGEWQQSRPTSLLLGVFVLIMVIFGVVNYWPVPQDATYVSIPAGTYMIGALPTDTNTVLQLCGKNMDCRYVDDKVQWPDGSRYTIKDGFQIKRTEVSNAEYKRCVDDGACSAPSNDQWNDSAYWNHPVTHVTWDQATAYAGWAGGSLPKREEWEIACRGPEARLYPWGNDLPDHKTANVERPRGITETEVVDSYPDGASYFGALNMVGNVQEWTNTPAGNFRYVRGGSYDSNAAQTNCIVNGWLSPGLNERQENGVVDEQANERDRATTGFRVVISSTQQPK